MNLPDIAGIVAYCAVLRGDEGCGLAVVIPGEGIPVVQIIGDRFTLFNIASTLNQELCITSHPLKIIA
ncbi:MAG: hypothetical protein JEZ04_00870 [Spirochaetales bacterium]|nr:hypothetical protein [Spirochaetales bacterium]